MKYNEYPYHLEDPHKGDGRKKHICPACERKSFKYYVDHNHQPLDKNCGRCDHEQSCGYHKPPRAFLEENPHVAERLKTNYTPRHFTPPPPPPPVAYLDLTLLNDFNKDRSVNNFFRFLSNTYDEQTANQVFDLYQVGTSPYWRYENGYATVFPQIDQQGRLHQLKFMAYNPYNGKRLKEDSVAEVWSERKKKYFPTSNSSPFTYFAGRKYLENKEAELQQCFFGEHLIDGSKPIGVVESEKTAMICSIHLPQFTWIATGGCNGCRWYDPKVFKPLIGNQILLFPDSGMEAKWEEKAQVLRENGVGVRLSYYCQSLPENSDIADLLLEERYFL